MAWSSAPRHLGSRDRYIGWSAEARRRNIRFIAYNTRFLILPWVTVPHLASHILGRVTSALPGDWERMYSHPVYFAETFIDPGRFRGTCYRAANWVLMGRTTGRGKASNSYIPNRSIKEVFGLALTRRFRELLSELERKSSRRRLDVDVEELDRVIDAAENGPLSKADRQKLKTTLHALVERLAQKRNTEKTNSVLEPKASSSTVPEPPTPAGHGRNAASAFTGAEKVSIQHAQLKPGDPCPECREGRVYRQREPKTLIRIVGQAPLKATVFEMERLRCNACCQMFTGGGTRQCRHREVRHHRRGDDRTAEVWHRSALQPDGAVGGQLGIPLPAATQWELMEQAAGPGQADTGRVDPAGGAGQRGSQR